MKLYIFHYHLNPGGVTGVIRTSIEALTAEMRDIEEYILVTGDPTHADTLADELPRPPRILHMPEIGYLSLSQLSEPLGELPTERAGTEDRAEIRERESSKLEARIREALLEQLEVKDAVWWVHNYHIGKNPVFTRALLRISEERPEIRLLLQIHDFPEEARYANLRYLSLIVSSTPYPVGKNIRYAAINSRDLRKLRDAGLPRDVTYLLPNPIPPESATTPFVTRSRSVRSAAARETGAGAGDESFPDRLARAFSRSFPLFDPAAPIAIYPVRTIRRKNILEAALLLGALGRPINLVVTLPGVSQQEKNYSAMIEHAYNEGIIRGLWGIGTEIESAGVRFEELQAGADLFISSSVQEGFGFQYIDSLKWGRPLIARDLEVLDDLRPMLKGSYFYSGVEVPTQTPSLSEVRPMLKMKYQERLDRLRETLPEVVLNRLEGEMSALLKSETVDFSFLMPQMQYTYVKDLRDPGFRSEVAALNPRTLSAIDTAVGGGPVPGAKEAMKAVREQFGFQAYADRFREIVTSFDSPISDVGDQTDGSVQRGLIEEFATLDRLRLLFE